jgi:hypothetical protein
MRSDHSAATPGVLATSFVANAILAQMRSGVQPPEQDCAALNRFRVHDVLRPHIDSLRSRVADNDLPWLLDLVKQDSPQLAAFGLSLLRPFCKQADVQERLRARWHNAKPFMRQHLLWRLLDDPQLPGEWHRRIFDFIIRDDWQGFREVTATFCGTNEELIVHVLRRLGDKTFPDSKKWVYLCRLAAGIDDVAVVRVLLGLGHLVGDPFAQEVTKVLLEEVACEGTRQVPLASPYEAESLLRSQFVAGAVLSHMRSGARPTEEEARLLNQFTMIGTLRGCVVEGDIPWLLDVVNSQCGWVATLCSGLLRKYIQRREIQDQFRSRWESADLFFRNKLMWRLLDDPQLSAEWQRRIFQFILDDWQNFRNYLLFFHGAPEKVIPEVLRRIGDPDFPVSKKWIYLGTAAAASDDPVAAKALVGFGRSLPDPFAREVAEHLLAHPELFAKE